MTDPATIRSLDSLVAFLVQEPESFENGAIQLALMPMPITCTDYFSLLFHCFRFRHILDPWPPRGVDEQNWITWAGYPQSSMGSSLGNWVRT